MYHSSHQHTIFQFFLYGVLFTFPDMEDSKACMFHASDKFAQRAPYAYTMCIIFAFKCLALVACAQRLADVLGDRPRRPVEVFSIQVFKILGPVEAKA